jgi:hypothetical protein
LAGACPSPRELIRERGMEKAIEEESAKQAAQAERVRGRFYELMAITYERSIISLEDDSLVEQLRPADVVQIMKLHLSRIFQSTHCARAGLHLGRICCPWRIFQLNEGRQRRMIQRYLRPGRVEVARGLHAFLFVAAGEAQAAGREILRCRLTKERPRRLITACGEPFVRNGRMTRRKEQGWLARS